MMNQITYEPHKTQIGPQQEQRFPMICAQALVRKTSLHITKQVYLETKYFFGQQILTLLQIHQT